MLSRCSIRTFVIWGCISFLLSTHLFAAAWPQEPKDFMGLRWNSSPQELDDHQKIVAAGRCVDKPEADDLRACPASIWLREEVRLELMFFYIKGKLAGVDISFSSKDYDFIKTAFLTRYNPPHKQKRMPVKTRMGDEYMNEELQWVGGGARVTLQKYDNQITNGKGHVHTILLYSYLLSRETDRNKKAVDAANQL